MERGWYLFSLCVTLMFSVRSEIVITGVGMNSLCNFTKYYSCEISFNVNFNVENYRPVSLLSIPSKILEKAVNKDFQDYLIENRILTDKQFGFRPNHSCETVLLCMVDQWAQNVDQGYVNGVAFIDMRKAFDAVNHSILLMKLKCVGCTERSLKWFTSYLGVRSQYVSIIGEKSSTRAINYGVP